MNAVRFGEYAASAMNFFRALRKKNSRMRDAQVNQVNAATEFYQALLQFMEEDFDEQAQKKSKSKKAKDENNLIRRLFYGEEKSSRTCMSCLLTSTTTTPINCIRLDLEKDATIQEMLAVYAQEEVLRGDEKSFCESCRRKTITCKRLALTKLPNILVFMVKRFEWVKSGQEELMKKVKLLDHCKFAAEINFKQWPHLYKPDARNRKHMDSSYKLYAVLVHTGPDSEGGHYIACVLDDGGRWHMIDDNVIKPVKTNDVLRLPAYQLFYKKEAIQTIKRGHQDRKNRPMTTD